MRLAFINRGGYCWGTGAPKGVTCRLHFPDSPNWQIRFLSYLRTILIPFVEEQLLRYSEWRQRGSEHPQNRPPKNGHFPPKFSPPYSAPTKINPRETRSQYARIRISYDRAGVFISLSLASHRHTEREREREREDEIGRQVTSRDKVAKPCNQSSWPRHCSGAGAEIILGRRHSSSSSSEGSWRQQPPYKTGLF